VTDVKGSKQKSCGELNHLNVFYFLTGWYQS